MRGDLESLVSVGRRVVSATQDQRVTFLAASVAYYAFISLIPALLLLVAIASAVFGDAFAITVLDVSREFLTPAGQEAVATAIASAEGRSGATVLGAIVLVWSTLKVFRALDTAFLQVYGVEERVTIVDQLIDAAAVALGIGVGIGVMVVTGAAIAALEILPGMELVGLVLLPGVLTLVFLPMYYLLPYPEVTIREALPGAAFAAVGWTALQTGFQVYAATAGQYQVYGVIGGILLLVTWLYFAAIVVILGAVINVVLAPGREVGFAEGSFGSPLAPHASPGSGPGSGPGTAPGAGPGATPDRQAHGGAVRPADMSERSAGDDRPRGATEEGEEERPRGAPDVAALDEEVRRLRAELDAFESDVERRTVDRPRLETELKEYVRKRMRRGHARGWGPYLVLLYGTVLTLGAFTFLDGPYAIAAMLVLGLSTLGLYTLFVIVGIGFNALETPGKALDYLRNRGEE